MFKKRPSVFFTIIITVSVIIFFSFNPFDQNGNTVNNLQQQSDDVLIKSIDPLIKVTPDFPSNSNETNEYNVARGEDVHIQLVAWNKLPVTNFSIAYKNSSTSKIPLTSIQKVGYVSISQPAGGALSEKVSSVNNLFPDPLIDINKPINLDNPSVNSFWMNVHIPSNIQPGTYTVLLNCTGMFGNNNAFNIKKEIKLYVSKASVNRNDYPWFSNWLFVDIPSLGPSVKKLQFLNNNADVIPFSADYWKKIDKIASFMHDAGQNVVLISPQRLAKYSYKNDSLIIDFSDFDSMVNCFLIARVIGRIEGWQICSRSAGWESDYIVHYIKKNDKGNAVFANGQPEDADVKAFYKTYLPALMNHLKTKGWLKYYYQHIADEPVDANAASYIRIIKMISNIAPELRTIEALQTTKVADYITIPVPQLDLLNKNKDYYQNLVSQGKEVWFYTAFLPQGTYANRFIEQEALQHRMLFWILAKYNLKGVLNWGFNYWETANPYTQLGKKSGTFILPAGDGFLTYPKFNGLQSSIRLETMSDGLNDYALLKLLKQKNPQLAASLINDVVKNYDKYISDVNAFREVRKTLLDNLN
jgi:hypothetical protein